MFLVFFFFRFFLVSTGWTRKQGWRKAWKIFSRHRANKLLRISIEATLWNLHKEAFIKASGPKSPSLCRRHGRRKEGTEARARHTRINTKKLSAVNFSRSPPSFALSHKSSVFMWQSSFRSLLCLSGQNLSNVKFFMFGSCSMTWDMHALRVIVFNQG